MFGIGSGELIVILVVALVLLGPQKLPGILRAAGKGYAQLRRMTMDVRSTLESEIRKADEAVRETEKQRAEAAASADAPKEVPGEAAESAKPSSSVPETPSETAPHADAAKENTNA